MATLTERSRASRARARPIESYCDPVKAGFAVRENRAIARLAHTAASMAAAERKRHGRKVEPEDRADAAQDALLAVYAEHGDNPRLADLLDPDRGIIPTGDGERETLRPSPAMVTYAGASLDRAHRGRELLDPEAGTGLVAQSAASRERGEALRSVATQLVDPSVSPIPVEVAEAISAAGIWPDDPMRQVIVDAVCPDLTAQDWIEAGERARTPAAIRKRRERGRGTLDADPKARTFADLLSEAISPTDAERREASRLAIERLLSVNPYGAGSSKQSLPDPSWRTRQPRIYPVHVKKSASLPIVSA